MRRRAKKLKQTDERRKLDAEAIKQEILRDARSIGVPTGAAEVVADKTVEKVISWIQKRAVVTSDDVNRQIAKEIAKYSQDLAYVYQNRGKII